MKRTTRSFFKRAGILFVVGAVFGSLGDFFHYASGVDGYPTSFNTIPVLGIPLWVPLLFGTACMGIGLTVPYGDRLLGRSLRLSFTRINIFMGLLWFLALYAASAFLPLMAGGGKDIVLGISSLAMWLALDRSWQGALVAVFTGACGFLVESILVRHGIFYYLPQSSNFLYLPSWLPWLYLSASIAVGNFGRALVKYAH